MPTGGTNGAGDSARQEAARAAGAQRRLEGKARHAGKAAGDWSKGAEGEQATADALAPLAAAGWRILHDLRAPDGGNIDHLAVGPPGVAVIDTKNWASPITITPDRRLVFSKYDHTADLDRLDDLADQMRRLLRTDGRKVAVRGYLVLAGDADRARPSQDVGDLRVLGLDVLAGRLRSARDDLDPETVDAVADTLAAAFPSMTAPVASAPVPTSVGAAVAAGPRVASDGGSMPDQPSPTFWKAHRVYYLTPWRKFGNDRIYLKDAAGTDVGWTDLGTGATTINVQGEDRRFAETLLAAADRTGLKVSPGDVPKEPTRLFGGRFLSRVARLHTALLVGQEWRSPRAHRLYGTLVDPSITSFDLGWVDLRTGDLHPSMPGPIHKDRRSPDVYLHLLHHLRPAPPARGS